MFLHLYSPAAIPPRVIYICCELVSLQASPRIAALHTSRNAKRAAPGTWFRAHESRARRVRNYETKRDLQRAFADFGCLPASSRRLKLSQLTGSYRTTDNFHQSLLLLNTVVTGADEIRLMFAEKRRKDVRACRWQRLAPLVAGNEF